WNVFRGEGSVEAFNILINNYSLLALRGHEKLIITTSVIPADGTFAFPEDFHENIVISYIKLSRTIDDLISIPPDSTIANIESSVGFGFTISLSSDLTLEELRQYYRDLLLNQDGWVVSPALEGGCFQSYNSNPGDADKNFVIDPIKV